MNEARDEQQRIENYIAGTIQELEHGNLNKNDFQRVLNEMGIGGKLYDEVGKKYNKLMLQQYAIHVFKTQDQYVKSSSEE